MNITETRVKLVNGASDRLKAYCSITIDGCFVVRDLKVIDGSNGLFVAMPSRKLATRCNSCSSKNHLRARFCNECGTKVSEARSGQGNSRTKLHADVAHPINAECRQFIQERVIEEFQIEVGRSKDPDYVASDYDDYNDDDDEASPYDSLIQELKADRQAERGQRDPEPNVVEEPEVEAVLYHDVASDREPEPEPVAELEEDLQPEDESEAEFGADLESEDEPEAEFGADLESEDGPEAEFGADLEPKDESEDEFGADLEPKAEPKRAATEVEAPAADAGDDDFGAGLV